MKYAMADKDTDVSFDFKELTEQAKQTLGDDSDKIDFIELLEIQIFPNPYEKGINIGAVTFNYKQQSETEPHYATFGLYTDGHISLFCN